MKAAKALQANPAMDLPGLSPDDQKVRSVAVLLKRNQAYKDAAKDHFKASPGKPHSSV